MGAVYQAASLSKGYRVKKFLVKDANQYPINVKFENLEEKIVDRTLFNRNNLYPHRKTMTFNKHINDFSFDIHYGNLTYLSTNDKR
jgi:hypoxia up-regulated 1